LTRRAPPRPKLLAAEELPRHPRQRRSLDKRTRLKEAALQLFGEQGYEKTSVDLIARRAGLAVGGFYQHFRSKRQLLVTLMDELVDHLSRLELRPSGARDPRSALHNLLSAAFDRDLRYLGAYRAWEEAVLSDPDLGRRQRALHEWTTGRVETVFAALQRLPGARPNVDVAGLARTMDMFFWSLLARAVRMPKAEIAESIDTATHLIYHALFVDRTGRRRRRRTARATEPA
jgi:AcrR family transcriptional regulator